MSKLITKLMLDRGMFEISQERDDGQDCFIFSMQNYGTSQSVAVALTRQELLELQQLICGAA